MTDDEVPEWIWAILNGLAGCTCEMAVGHRHDIINNHHSDMNMCHVHFMGMWESHDVKMGLRKSTAESIAAWKLEEQEYL